MKKLLFMLAILATILLWIAAPALAEGAGPPTLAIDLTPLFQAAISVLAAWIATKLAPWIEARTTAQLRELLMMTVRTLVYAAEQLYQSESGEFKLKYVETQLKRRGFNIDRQAIEAAVREMNLGSVFATGTGDVIIAGGVRIEGKPPDTNV